MAKIRVHDLAKELGMESKELVDMLKSKNIEVKSQSALEDDVAAEIRKEAAVSDHFCVPWGCLS